MVSKSCKPDLIIIFLRAVAGFAAMYREDLTFPRAFRLLEEEERLNAEFFRLRLRGI